MPTTNVETFTPVELVAVRPDLLVTIPITVASGNNLAKGVAIGIITATGKAKAYNNANTDGSETCKGFLLDAVDATGGDTPGTLIIGGYLVKAKLTGLDAAGEADLGGRSFPGGIFAF